MSLVAIRTEEPETTPISLADAKAECRVYHSDQDSLILGYIEASVSIVEAILGRSLIEQTWQVDVGCFDSRIYLPVGNLIAVTEIVYYDSANESVTLDEAVYGAFTDRCGPYVATLSGQSWPAAYSRTDAIRITWNAGYGPADSDVPAAIRMAIKLAIREWYDGNLSTGVLPENSLALLAPFRRLSI